MLATKNGGMLAGEKLETKQGSSFKASNQIPNILATKKQYSKHANCECICKEVSRKEASKCKRESKKVSLQIHKKGNTQAKSKIASKNAS